jgi:tripartite-type tricarboxylate transporter receptor subunit TctC
MQDNNERRKSRAIQRRRFVKAIGGTAAAGVLAGCSGDGGDGSGDGGSDGGDGGDGGMDGGDGGSDGGDGGGDGGDGGDGGSWEPSEEVTLIVPYGPGGGYDFYTRALANTLNEQDMIPTSASVQNVDGAGGITATNQVWNADPDGHTFMIINTESFAVAQIARDAAQFDLAEMSIMPRVAGTLRCVAVSTETDITTFSELNEATKNGEINWGNQGPSTTSAINAKALAALGGEEIFTVEDYQNNSVTFGGRGEEYTALKRGDVQVMSGSFSSLLEYQQSGDIRYILMYSNEDSPPEEVENSDCVTFATSEVPIQNTDQIQAVSGGPFHRIFAGPPELPDEIHSYWCDTIGQAIQSDHYAQQAEEADRPITFGDCETAEQGVVTTIETYQENKDLLRELGILGG